MWPKKQRANRVVDHPYSDQCPFSHKQLPKSNHYLMIFKANLAGLVLAFALVLTLLHFEIHPIEISFGQIMIFSAWLIIGPKLNIYLACAYPLLHMLMPHMHCSAMPFEFISGPIVLIWGLTISWSIHKCTTWCIKDSWYKLLINCVLIIIIFAPVTFGIHWLEFQMLLKPWTAKLFQIDDDLITTLNNPTILLFSIVKTCLSTATLLVSLLIFCSICKIVAKITPNWQHNY